MYVVDWNRKPPATWVVLILTDCSGDYFFVGGPLLLIAGLLEFFLGNTFTFVVFISYGELIATPSSLQRVLSWFDILFFIAGIFFTLAATFQPFFNAAGAYSISGLDNLSGSETAAFNSSFGTWTSVNHMRSTAESL
jgi:hypothetical protein